MQPSTFSDQDNLRGSLWMIAAMAGFALEDSLLKLATQSLPVSQVLVIFGALGALIFYALAKIQKTPVFTKDTFSAALRIRVIFEFTGRLFYILALAMTSLSGTTVILQATPLVVVGAAALFMNEPVGWRRWSAICVGLIGVLIVLQPSSDDFSALSILAVIGMLGFAGRDLASRAAPVSVTPSVLGVYGFLTLILAGASYSLWERRAYEIPNGSSIAILGLSIGIGVFAYTSLMTAMRTGQVSVVTPFRYIRLLFGIALGVIVFGEPMSSQMIWGSVIIVGAGLFLLSRSKSRA